MHTKWLTYRVSWCNVRVKLGQSLWAGGALAKRLPLLQETDRQWEKTCQSASAVTSHIYIISLSRYRHHVTSSASAGRRGDDVTSSVGMETKQTFIQNSRLPPQSRKWEKRCWIISNYVWWWRGWWSGKSWWWIQKKKHLKQAEQLIMMNQTQRKQTDTVCVKIQ